MPFTFLNDPETGLSQDEIEADARDFTDIILPAISHGTLSTGNWGVGPTGVQAGPAAQAGCAVTEQGTPGQGVTVAAGTVRIGGRRVAVTAGDVAATAADGTNARIDLVTVDTAGTKAIVAGTAAVEPFYPAVPAGRVVLARVFRAASDNVIGTVDIQDKRVVIGEPPYEDVTWYGALGNDSTDNAVPIQLAIDTAADSAATRGRGRTVFFPHGIYRTTVAIVLKPAVYLLGDGRPGDGSAYGSWISGATTGMTVINDPEDTIVKQHGWEIQNIGICNASPSQTGLTGIHISGTNRYLIDSCVILSQADGDISTGIYMDAGATQTKDNNWNLISRVNFRRVTIGVDGYQIPKLSFCNYVPGASMSGTIGVRGLAHPTDNALHAQNGRIIGCEFQQPIGTGGIGILNQGSFLDIAACHFEGGTGDTTSVHIKLVKIAGSNSQSGTRNNISACSFAKGATAVEVGANVTDTFIAGVHAVGMTNILVDNGVRTTYLPSGTGEVARLPVALDLPVVTAPGSPASGSQRFYVDTADGIFKSKSSAGIISVYGARTRSLFIDASVFRMDAASGVKLGSPPNAVDGVQLADAVLSGAYCNLIMPVDVIAGTVTIRPTWAPGATTGAATVRWQMNIKLLTAADVTAAGTTVAWTGDSAARTINVEVLETGQASTGVSPAASDRIRLEIQRDGAHASDTYAGAVNLLGLRIDYQANN